jgi:hypothetical protein
MDKHRQNSSGRGLLDALYVLLTIAITTENGRMEIEETHFYYRPALACFPCVKK